MGKRIFISYSRTNRDIADDIAARLGTAGHRVFIDREALRAGDEYDKSIKASIDGSDIFIFLISPNSLSEGSYALTEAKYAQEKWPSPSGHVLPVMIEDVPFRDIPAYLRSVTVLHPEGDVAAEVVDAVSATRPMPKGRVSTIAASVLVTALILGGAWIWTSPQSKEVLAPVRQWLGIEAVERTATAVENLAENLSALGALGGLVTEPKTEIEFYNNALVYERRGDALSARKMYEGALQKNAQAIDLHQRYAALLKAQEGRIGAREIYAKYMKDNPDNKAAAMTAATLLPLEQRKKELQDLVSGKDAYGPAWFEIARLTSPDAVGTQTLGDKKSEKRALKAFVDAHDRGEVYKHFLRKEEAEEWSKTAATRLAAYRTLDIKDVPVSLSGSSGNSGWTFRVAIAEPVRAVRYQLPEGTVQSITLSNKIDPLTGAKKPRDSFSIGHTPERYFNIKIWYDDVNGTEQGPFDLKIDVIEHHIKKAKHHFTNIIQDWVSFDSFGSKNPIHGLHISDILYEACALNNFSYGINKDVPDTVWKFDECNFEDPSGHDTDLDFMELDKKPEFVSVQLHYRDGTKSPIRIFRPKK